MNIVRALDAVEHEGETFMLDVAKGGEDHGFEAVPAS